MPRTPAEIGNRVFARLTSDDREHLARAMAAAALSGRTGEENTLCGDLGNAGLCVPVGAGKPVTEQAMRDMCRVLEEARRSPHTVGDDWICLLKDAFGHANRERLVALFAAAAEPIASVPKLME
ncbi:hypothetical protein [Methylobacterium sp. Leaf111]|uniref:hypothetical protein n=1 Tax=Methylobacterium sp. Leaf111 TaxID=1736257 RepID=UPI000A596B62|nr:hypothetical protein [Methylobacterium sp. Leaf111]